MLNSHPQEGQWSSVHELEWEGDQDEAAAVLVKRVPSPSWVPADCCYDKHRLNSPEFQEKLEIWVFRHSLISFSALQMNLVFKNCLGSIYSQ